MKRTARKNVNNKKQVKSKGMFLGFLFLVVVVALGLYYFYLENRGSYLGLVLWACFGGVIALFKWGGFCYVEVMIEKGNLDVKYYGLFPIGRKYKRILIPTKKISQVKIAPGIFSIGRRLIIIRKSKGQLINYPAVGLAAFNQGQVKKLEQLLRDMMVR